MSKSYTLHLVSFDAKSGNQTKFSGEGSWAYILKMAEAITDTDWVWSPKSKSIIVGERHIGGILAQYTTLVVSSISPDKLIELMEMLNENHRFDNIVNELINQSPKG